MGRRGAYHCHIGKEKKETTLYYPEREPAFERKDNPHGYKCEWCNKIIQWTYRNGELWEAPRVFCDNWICQRVYEHRSMGMETQEVILPFYLSSKVQAKR